MGKEGPRTPWEDPDYPATETLEVRAAWEYLDSLGCILYGDFEITRPGGKLECARRLAEIYANLRTLEDKIRQRQWNLGATYAGVSEADVRFPRPERRNYSGPAGHPPSNGRVDPVNIWPARPGPT